MWVMERNLAKPRELVGAQQLRELIGSAVGDSSKMAQVDWIPGTNKLAFTGMNYYVQGEGESHAFPVGLFVVDAGTAELKTLITAETSLKFSSAPDGRRIAVMTKTGFGFLASDGSVQYQEQFAYPEVGFGGAAWPSGAWTQDARAFLLAAAGEIRRVPFDGGPIETLATLVDSHPDSVAFAPNGRHVANVTGQRWVVTALDGSTQPVVAPAGAYFFWRKIHWSPAGVAYALDGPNLLELCPDATQQTETCGRAYDLGAAAVENGRADVPADIAYIEWIDSERFVFTTFEPGDLYFGNLAGEVKLISTDAVFFSAMAGTCRNAAEFAGGGEGLQVLDAAADTNFEIGWRLRNSGTCTWSDAYQLVYLGGNVANATAAISLKEQVAPGGEIDLTVTLSSPAETGAFRGEWRLFGSDGRPFGPALAAEGQAPDYELRTLEPSQIEAVIPSIMGWLANGDGTMWALSALNTGVSGIDHETNQTTEPVLAGELLEAIAAGNGSVWVVGGGADLRRIDPATNAVSEIITVPLQEFNSLNAVATGAGAVWVSSSSDGSVTRINPETLVVEAMIAVPWAGKIVATENAVWVVSQIDSFLTRIDPDTNEVVATIEFECTLYGIDANEDGVWAACIADPVLFRIDPATNRVVARFAVGASSPKDVALGSGFVWVTARRSGILMQIDTITNQVIAVYQLGQNTFDLAAVSDEVWVSVQGDGAIWRIKLAAD